MSVANAGNLFPVAQHSSAIKEHTREKGRMCALNVGNPSSEDIILLNTSAFTQRPQDCREYNRSPPLPILGNLLRILSSLINSG